MAKKISSPTIGPSEADYRVQDDMGLLARHHQLMNDKGRYSKAIGAMQGILKNHEATRKSKRINKRSSKRS